MSSILSNLVPATLPPIGDAVSHKDDESFDAGEFQGKSIKYDKKNLNEGQRRIFDHMMNHPDSMIVIHGRPGTGKTFTLRSIACAWPKPVVTLIYKHTLLRKFKHLAETCTVADFFMKLFLLKFSDYKSLQKELNGNKSGVYLLTRMTELLAEARMPNLKGALVILDEYTVIPRPLLVLLLTLLKYYKIGTIICGDTIKLGNIDNVSYARYTSSDIADRFADETFGLNINHRCANDSYNDIVDFVSQFCSVDESLDHFGHAILAALFPQKLVGSSRFSDVHLAGTHVELTYAVHTMVMKENIPTSFYYIAQPYPGETLLEEPQILTEYRIKNRCVGKFLPYLPLAVGTKYFVDKYSEFSLAELIEFDQRSEEATLKTESGERICVKKKSNNEVVFGGHRNDILREGPGMIYNYPIYPANMMSIHMSQGCTIRHNLDLHMLNGNYQDLYVALSRVSDPEQIVRIIVPNLISHAVSSLINFREHALNQEITADILRERMANYEMYWVERMELGVLANLLEQFMQEESVERKCALRDELIEAVANERRTILRPPVMSPDNNANAIKTFIDYKDVFLALSRIDENDRHVWLREFIESTPDMSVLRDELTILNHAARTTSRFIHEVDMKHQKKEAITTNWLIEQLNILSKDVDVSRT